MATTTSKTDQARRRKAPAPTRKPARRKAAKAKATTATKTKAQRAADEQAALAAMAQAKAKPAARITGSHIRAVQRRLKGQQPSAYLGITPTMLAQLASGKKTKANLKPEPRGALMGLGNALGSESFYGKKLAAMLWAIEVGVKSA